MTRGGARKRGRLARVTVFGLATFVTACGPSDSSAPTLSPTPAPLPIPGPVVAPLRVLLLTATAGFRHDSIAAARVAFAEIAAASREFVVQATEDVATVTDARLAETDVLVFGLTSGELPFDQAQRTALLNFVSRGGGFAGFHSATDTLYAWPEYGALVGAYFKEHPWTQIGSVRPDDRAHPATAGLGTFALHEEFYTFRDNPRSRVHVVFSLDASSVGAAGDYPLVWTQSVGSGRSYYNALGHFGETWADPRMRAQILAAIRWVGRR